MIFATTTFKMLTRSLSSSSSSCSPFFNRNINLIVSGDDNDDCKVVVADNDDNDDVFVSTDDVVVDVNRTSMVFMQSKDANSTSDLSDVSPILDITMVLLLTFLTGLTLITILGNTLVIVAVATTRRLRSVTNCFIVSLSVADLLVGCLVMPLSLIYQMIGTWPFGYFMCELWSSLDIMLCTASILNLCCISLDRYFAITRPLTYTVKRNKRLALGMIGVVWLASAAVTLPPLFGWYERSVSDVSHCQYVSDKGYVIYSACGSFYIPLVVMLFVYTRIFIVIYRRNKIVKQQKQYQKHGFPNGCAATAAAATGDDVSQGRTLRPHYITSRKDGSVGELRASSSDCFVSLEMVSDSLLTVRPKRDSNPQKMIDMNRTGLYRSRSYQFQFQASGNCNSGGPTSTTGEMTVPMAATLRKSSSKVESHLLTVPNWVYNQRTPSSSSGALNAASSTSSKSFYTDSSCLYVSSSDASDNKPPKLSLPSLGLNSDQHQQSSNVVISPNVVVIPKDYHRRKHARGLRMSFRKETKATTTIAVVVGGFVVCWLPFFIIYIAHSFCETCTFSPLLVSSLTWLGWANSAVNPFIYAFYNMDFRAAFWKLTFGRCIKKRPKGKNSIVLYPQVWRSRLKSNGANGVPSIVMVQSDVM